MTNKPHKSVFRIPKRHAPDDSIELDESAGKHLLQDQSLRDSIVAGLIVVILFSALWAMSSTLIDRIFPWMTLILGIFIGLVVRRAGHGLDWRFPVLAAAITLLGSLVGNVVVAAAFTAAALDTSTFTILRAVTSMTWPVFFDEAVSAADFVYAFCGAGIAAFYANRRLSRAEYRAVRMWQEQQKDDASG